MNCQNRIVHTVREGDSLYRLSRQYHTTVTELILGNPGVNPYNLQVGMQLDICPGESYTGPMLGAPGESTPSMPGESIPSTPIMPGGPTPSIPSTPSMPGRPTPSIPSTPSIPGSQASEHMENLRSSMRIAWLDLLYWTRMYLMSVSADAKDQQAVEERMMQAADEITDVFATHLPVSVTRQLRNLLTEHVELTGEVIRAQKSENTENFDNLIKAWYGNANQIATLLGNQNPFFGGRETRNMLLNYLDMTRESIEHQMNGAYGESIDTFRDMKTKVLEMADYFARGLMAR